MDKLDVIIIGGGPIGIACGIEAKRNGLSYLIIEKGVIVNSLYNYPQEMTFFSSSDKLEIAGIPFVSTRPRPSKPEALEYYRRLANSHDLDINLFERVTNIEPVHDGYFVKTSRATYSARNIIVAIGFYDHPNLLNIPGEDLPKVYHYYKDPHYFARQKVVVIGASNSAVDAALEIYRKGGDVTLVVRAKEIGERVKYWVKPDIENRIKEGSVKACFESEVLEIREKEVIIRTQGREQSIENDFVLALTGYMPDFEFLQKAGIEFSNDGLKRPTYNPTTMETNQKGIYLAGVVCGGMETHKWFIENSRIHAPMIVDDIRSKVRVEK